MGDHIDEVTQMPMEAGYKNSCSFWFSQSQPLYYVKKSSSRSFDFRPQLSLGPVVDQWYEHPPDNWFETNPFLIKKIWK